MEKISIKEFVKGYENRATDKLKEQYVKDHLEIKSNVSTKMKILSAENVIYSSMRDKKTNMFKQNTFAKCLLQVISMITLFTNLTIDKDDDIFDLYDLIKSSDVISAIVSKIPENDRKEYENIIECLDIDYRENNTTLNGYINKIMNYLYDNNILNSFNELINKLKSSIENLDEETINKMVNIKDYVNNENKNNK